jgi:hypothetical protein
LHFPWQTKTYLKEKMMRKLLVLSLLVAIVGCGGGGSNSTTQANSQQLTITSGNWDFAGQDQGGSFVVGGMLTQSGANLSGIFHLFNSVCLSVATDIPVSGTAGAASATLTSSPVASQVISATFTGSASTVSGNFNVTGGCAAGSVGTFSGTLVPSLNGTWSGSFLSVSGPPAVNVTAPLTQSATANGDGLFALSGTAALSNSVCFTSSTIAASAVSGRVIALILNNNDGSQTTFAGSLTSPSTAKQITGSYSVSGGSCNGDSGTGTLTRP